VDARLVRAARQELAMSFAVVFSRASEIHDDGEVLALSLYVSDRILCLGPLGEVDEVQCFGPNGLFSLVETPLDIECENLHPFVLIYLLAHSLLPF
jgi:hypothetical protein